MSEYKTRCEIHFTKTYTEGILNGTDPVLKDELVPVTIEENGTVKKANLESEWYSYEKKEWANSIILDDQYETLNSQGKVAGATKNDGYVSFDGVDDYIDLGLENYEFTEGIALSATFNLTKDQTSYILGNWEGAGGGLYYYSSKIRFELYINGQYSMIYADCTVGSQINVIGTYDNQVMRLYINGKLVDEYAVEGVIKASSMPLLLGANPQPSGSHVKFGSIDILNIQIYSRTLDEEEIPIVSEGKVVNNEGLLRYVDFTDKSYEDNEIIQKRKSKVILCGSPNTDINYGI